jgi:hypothetical protein
MTHSDYFETIHAGSDRYDYTYVEMERVYKKLNAVYNPKNKNPFWKRNITGVNPNWRNNCVSFSASEIISIREFSAKHSAIIDKEIEIILIEEFEKSIINSGQKNEVVVEKRKRSRYMWPPLESWEEKLYDYMETCV